MKGLEEKKRNGGSFDHIKQVCERSRKINILEEYVNTNQNKQNHGITFFFFYNV